MGRGPGDTDSRTRLRERLERALTQNPELDRRISAVLLPCGLSFLVVPLTNAVDTAWIGRMGSVLALAGQSAANSVFSTFFFLVSFLPTVMAPFVASAVGEGDTALARDRIAETMFLATVFGMLGTVALSIFPRACLSLVLAPASPALPYAETYLSVRSLSLLPALWGAVGFAALRGAQDTKTPLKISAASNIFNALLDPILIFACSLGVAGAAAATALAELGAGMAYLVVLSRRNLMQFRSCSTRVPSLERLLPLLTAGGALQFRNMCLNFAFVYATRTSQLADPTGVQAAAYGITMQFWNLGGVLLSALQASAAILVPAARARASSLGEETDAGEAARGMADRLMGWGGALGILLAAVQVAAIPLLGVFSIVPEVRDAALRPALIASLMQAMNGVVFAGEGIMMGCGSYVALATQTALGAAGMVIMLWHNASRGGGVTGIWLAIMIFNVVQLIGVLRQVYATGPLCKESLR